MDPGGYEWRQSHLYCSTGQNKCNNRETSGNRVGKIQHSVALYCKTILNQCRTDKELRTYAVVFLKIMFAMLQQTETTRF